MAAEVPIAEVPAAEVPTAWTEDENTRIENSWLETEHLGDTPERWIIVAEAVGNGRTATEVRHYCRQLYSDLYRTNIIALHARAATARA